jgi:signal peptidase
MTKAAVGRLVTNIILAIAIVCFASTMAFVALGNNSNDSYIFGLKPYIITSGSMAPELEVNSLVLIAETNYDEVQVGDIISYRSGSYDLPICHRVIDKTDDGLITQGDNVSIPDGEAVTADMVRGKLIWHTNLLAGYITFVQERGVLVGVILPLLVVLAIVAAIYLMPRRHKSNEEPDDGTTPKSK